MYSAQLQFAGGSCCTASRGAPHRVDGRRLATRQEGDRVSGRMARRGPTDLGNLALLCGRHHTVVHERGLTATVTALGVTWDT